MVTTGTKYKLLASSLLVAFLAVSIAFMGGCTRQSSTGEPSTPAPPPTELVTLGYIRGYDHKLGYSFEYPEDWEMRVLECESPIEAVMKFAKDKEEPTRIEISIKLTNFKSLAEVKAFGYVSRESILEDGFVEINDRKAYEVIFKQLVAVDPDTYNKAKWVIFLVNDREYTIRCYATEDLYAASEEVFDHVINLFIIR